MQHFGKDALTGYNGEKFDMSCEDILKLFNIYSKEYGNKKMKVWKEIQEYPNKSLEYAVMDKSYNKSKSIGGF